MKYVFHGIFLVIFSIIQPTWLEYIAIFGVKPNLFLIYTVIISCYCSKKEGAIIGFFFGLILDLLTGNAIGLNGCLMLLVAFFTAHFCEKVIRNNTLPSIMVIVFVTTLFYELLYYIIAFLGDLDLGNALLKVLIPECLYCSIASIPLYYIVPKTEKSV
ncbi:MAG: rod shape-determining protein MreD [Clostridia bacterium]|nr:rod shape-determining protein MreD [Clostridia bacterium]